MKKGQKSMKTVEAWKIINKTFSFGKLKIKPARDLWAGNMPIYLLRFLGISGFDPPDLMFFLTLYCSSYVLVNAYFFFFFCLFLKLTAFKSFGLTAETRKLDGYVMHTFIRGCSRDSDGCSRQHLSLGKVLVTGLRQ